MISAARPRRGSGREGLEHRALEPRHGSPMSEAGPGNRGAGRVRRLRAHHAQGRAHRALPRPVARAKAGLLAVRCRGRSRRAGSASPPARPRRRSRRGSRSEGAVQAWPPRPELRRTPSPAGEPSAERRLVGARTGRRRPPPRPERRRRDPRHVRAVPTNAQLKLERALDLFNGSEHLRTVAGLARTLGPPQVSATTSSGVCGRGR